MVPISQQIINIVKLTPLEPWIQSRIGSRSQRLLRSDLEATQLEGLRRTIRWGREKSRFYLGRLADAPAEISRLEDLVLYPFTTPEDLRAEGGQLLCVPQGEIQRVVTLYTSGTTGSPKRIYFTREDQELTVDFFQHGMSTFTSAGDQVMILLPFERPGSVGDLLRAGLERLEAFPACYGPVRDPEHALAVMQSEHADVLVGAPVQILTLLAAQQVVVERLDDGVLKILPVERALVLQQQEAVGQIPHGAL